MLLAQHNGCLMFTDEGFEDAVAAFPDARGHRCSEKPSTSPEFAHVLREFCAQLVGAARLTRPYNRPPWPRPGRTCSSPPNGAAATAPDSEPEEQKRGFFRRLRENLSKSREALGGELRATFSGPLDDETWERLEEILIYADVGRAHDGEGGRAPRAARPWRARSPAGRTSSAACASC